MAELQDFDQISSFKNLFPTNTPRVFHVETKTSSSDFRGDIVVCIIT